MKVPYGNWFHFDNDVEVYDDFIIPKGSLACWTGQAKDSQNVFWFNLPNRKGPRHVLVATTSEIDLSIFVPEGEEPLKTPWEITHWNIGGLTPTLVDYPLEPGVAVGIRYANHSIEAVRGTRLEMLVEGCRYLIDRKEMIRRFSLATYNVKK